jgi:ribosome biogenesis GTPase
MDLASLGYDADFASHPMEPGLVPARVSGDYGAAFEVLAACGRLRAEVSGRLAYLAAGPEDRPAVGDWLAVAPRPQESAATIHAVLPRRSALVRKEAGRSARAQVLAANVDAALLVVSANRDFSPHRIERAISVVREAGALPIVVVSKSDLAADPARLVAEAQAVAPGVPVLALSALTGAGLDALAPELEPRRTLVVLGSSGVGKSSLINRLLGRELLATREIRADDDKGRHATTHRQLVALPGGALMIDTPGLRELALFESGAGVAAAFPEVEALFEQCRFSDCTHAGEPGCAVAAALDDGRLPPERWESYRKLEREARALHERRDPHGRHERRERMKRFNKARRERIDKRDPR